MNLFYVISSLLLYGLAILSFFLPYKSGKKTTGLVAALIFGVIITLTLILKLDFVVVYLWPVIIGIQIIFIVYWVFILLGRKKTGTILALVIMVMFLLITIEPWIKDWTFNKRDVKKILIFHGFEIKDSFVVIENESSGFRDYYQTFTIKISDYDYQQIARRIKTSRNYVGLFTDLTKQLPKADFRRNDTVDFETKYYFEREYWSKQQMNDGTFHFRFQLSKTDKELSYIGSNE